jgi:Rrf2 family protein
MQFTRQTEYAIKTMLELASLPEGEILAIKVISEHQGIPIDFLKKTVHLLSLGGLVYTKRGVQGGIQLARSPKEINIADIVQAIEGPLAINKCLTPGYTCPNQESCLISPVLARAQEAFLKELKRQSLADLLSKDNKNI